MSVDTDLITEYGNGSMSIARGWLPEAGLSSGVTFALVSCPRNLKAIELYTPLPWGGCPERIVQQGMPGWSLSDFIRLHPVSPTSSTLLKLPLFTWGHVMYNPWLKPGTSAEYCALTLADW